jgi:hypothetical protein
MRLILNLLGHHQLFFEDKIIELSMSIVRVEVEFLRAGFSSIYNLHYFMTDTTSLSSCLELFLSSKRKGKQ